MRCAWYDTQGHDLQNGTVIFTICFVAKKAGALDESLEVWNGLYPCAYTPQLQFRVLDIYFTSEQNAVAANEPSTSVPFTVYPNPFINSTSLKFDGDNYGEIDIAVFDENGGQILAKTITATGSATNLDMDGVEAGTYFVVAKMPDGSTFATTIISR